MSPLKKLLNKLDGSKIKYKVVEHRKVYTTFDAAQTQKIKPQQVAKTLLVKGDNNFYFAIIPGNRNLDSQKLKAVMNKYLVQQEEKSSETGSRSKSGKIKKLSIANEAQIKRNFTKTMGALPPFGSLYKCQTFADKLLLKNSKINLNAGSFTQSLEMTSAQYKKFEEPIEGSFSKARKK
ncbi:YbaK/EbsC family protein [Patescibacteria group bacterium]|nr:YbaK/EbsC family protein [Patescibacteria group bacterium]